MKNEQAIETFERVFLGKGSEPLTDELISELVKTEGIPENDLKELQKLGAVYHRDKKSFTLPPEFDV